LAFDLKKFSIPLKDDINFTPGLTASVDLDVLRQAADVWFDTLIKVVNNITIPNV